MLPQIYNEKRKVFYGKTKEEILKKVQAFESVNITEKVIDIPNMLFYKYCHYWLFRGKKNANESLSRHYEILINNYIKESFLGSASIRVLNDNQKEFTIQLFKDYLFSLKEDVSAEVIEDIYKLLVQISRYAFRNNHINYNWMQDIKKSTFVSRKSVSAQNKKEASQL